MSAVVHGSSQRLALRPELVSAVSGAALEVGRLLSSCRSVYSDEIGVSRALAGVVRFSTQASAFDLQRFAKARLAAVRADGQARPSSEALSSFESVLRVLVADNGPTPQVGATPSGSVEIQWLVDGTLVSTLFDESGACYVLALSGNDEVLLDAELPTGELSEDVRSNLAQMLRSMSEKIVERPRPWGARGAW